MTESPETNVERGERVGRETDRQGQGGGEEEEGGQKGRAGERESVKERRKKRGKKGTRRLF